MTKQGQHGKYQLKSKSIKIHHKNHHRLSIKKSKLVHVTCEGNKKQKTSSVDNDNNPTITSDDEMHYFNDNLLENETPFKDELNFSNEACNKYFFHQRNNNNADAYLVSNACFNGEVDPKNIDDNEKKLILLITNLCMILTRDQYGLVTSILELHEEVICKRCYSKKNQSKQSFNKLQERQ